MNLHSMLSTKTLICLSILAMTAGALRADDVRHISARTPVVGHSRELAAQRPSSPALATALNEVGAKHNPWKKRATLPGAVVHDI
jgi:hypothetical protein